VPDFEVFATIFPKLQGAKIILDIHDIVPEFYAGKFHENEKSILFKALAMMERLSSKYSGHVIISNHLWEKTILSRSVKRDKCAVIMNYQDESISVSRRYRCNRKRKKAEHKMRTKTISIVSDHWRPFSRHYNYCCASIIFNKGMV
jgi:hypothetical protein